MLLILMFSINQNQIKKSQNSRYLNFIKLRNPSSKNSFPSILIISSDNTAWKNLFTFDVILLGKTSFRIVRSYVNWFWTKANHLLG
jgi:hypothetical protein